MMNIFLKFNYWTSKKDIILLCITKINFKKIEIKIIHE